MDFGSASTFPVDLPKLNTMRTNEGLSPTALAMRAGFSAKTLQRVMNGERVAISTIKKIADVFGLKPQDLIAGAAPNAPNEKELRLASGQIRVSDGTGVTLVKQGEITSFDEAADLAEVMQLVVTLWQAKKPFFIVGINPGMSIHIELLFESREDVRRIIEAFCDHRFATFDIYELRVSMEQNPTKLVESSAKSVVVTYKKEFGSPSVQFSKATIDFGDNHVTDCFPMNWRRRGLVFQSAFDVNGQPREYSAPSLVVDKLEPSPPLNRKQFDRVDTDNPE